MPLPRNVLAPRTLTTCSTNRCRPLIRRREGCCITFRSNQATHRRREERHQLRRTAGSVGTMTRDFSLPWQETCMSMMKLGSPLTNLSLILPLGYMPWTDQEKRSARIYQRTAWPYRLENAPKSLRAGLSLLRRTASEVEV